MHFDMRLPWSAGSVVISNLHWLASTLVRGSSLLMGSCIGSGSKVNGSTSLQQRRQ
jgi:hypothetical protein